MSDAAEVEIFKNCLASGSSLSLESQLVALQTDNVLWDVDSIRSVFQIDDAKKLFRVPFVIERSSSPYRTKFKHLGEVCNCIINMSPSNS